MEKTNDQVGKEESAPSSSRKKPRLHKTVRLPARIASHFFELTKTLGFERDGMTVEWLIKQFESDEDPCKFSSVNELRLINSPKRRKTGQPGRLPVAKDRHRLTEDGRDRRVRVLDTCLPQLIHLTQKLALKSDGETIEFLLKKYWLSSCIRPLRAMAPDSTSAFSDTNFNGAHLIPDNETMIIRRGSSIPSHDNQQNAVGRYEQKQLKESAFNANPNSEQYGIAQMGSLQNSRYLEQQEHQYTGSSSAMAGERVAGPADNFSYLVQVWNPNNTSSTSIAQTYCLQNQYPLPYERIINGNRSGIAISSAYVQQLFSQGVVGNGLGEEPTIPQDHRDIGEMRQPAQRINNNNDAISMNLRDLRLQLCYHGMGGA